MLHSFHPELQYRIALTMIPAIGPINARKLISKAGSARKVLQMSSSSLEKIHGIGPRLAQSISKSILLEKAEKEIKFLEKEHIRALYFEDKEYPEHLKECVDAPILLYTKGEKGLNSKRTLSVVGTRNASSYGKDLCRNIVLELGELMEDLCIISGLAFGIDVIAHRAALEGGIPTVAVLGHGLHTLYPQAHKDTAKKIRLQGALATDFHSGMDPEPKNFLRRNRIIAGMAEATLVVESAQTGGSLITANMASSYHRDVLAVPGRATDARSKGCNRLIRKNVAAMVESAQDVMDHLNWTDRTAEEKVLKPAVTSFTMQEKQLLELISMHSGLGPGELSELAGIAIHEVLARLTEMELKRWVSVEPGNLYQSRIQFP